MSAFIVSEMTIRTIATGIYRDPEAQYCFTELRDKFNRDTGTYDLEAMAKLVRGLWAMNVRAVNYRYNERNRTPKIDDVMLELDSSWATTRMQLFKSLGCLGYQCSEGTVPNTRLFRGLRAYEGAVGKSIVMKMPEYDAAAWG